MEFPSNERSEITYSNYLIFPDNLLPYYDSPYQTMISIGFESQCVHLCIWIYKDEHLNFLYTNLNTRIIRRTDIGLRRKMISNRMELTILPRSVCAGIPVLMPFLPDYGAKLSEPGHHTRFGIIPYDFLMSFLIFI